MLSMVYVQFMDFGLLPFKVTPIPINVPLTSTMVLNGILNGVFNDTEWYTVL